MSNFGVHPQLEQKEAPAILPHDAIFCLEEARTLLERVESTVPPPVRRAHQLINHALHLAQSPASLFQSWAALIYIGLITLAELGFIYLYCRWHGITLSLLHPFQIYSPENIRLLSQINFVAFLPDDLKMPTTMSFVAEVLMWSSVGVWGHRIYSMGVRYEHRRANFPFDVANYIGILARNTSIAAIILMLLHLSKFEVFGVSLERFEVTAGLAFLLGFFGDDSVRFLNKLRIAIFGQAEKGVLKPDKG